MDSVVIDTINEVEIVVVDVATAVSVHKLMRQAINRTQWRPARREIRRRAITLRMVDVC